MHYTGIGLFGMVSLHYTGIGLFGKVSLGIFGYTYSWLHYFLVAKLLLVAQISMDNAAFHPWIQGSHTASYNFGLKSCLEHPALLAGCVCVYLLKRSKTCTRFTTSI